MSITRAIVAPAVLSLAASAHAGITFEQNFDDNNVASGVPNYTSNNEVVGGVFTGSGRTFSGTGLGWQATFTDSRGTGENGPVDGPESGDFIGVTADTSLVGAFTTGNKGWVFNDTDGTITLIFDSIDATNLEGLTAGFDWFAGSTSYEDTDFIEVSVNGDVLYRLSDNEIEDIDGAWVHVDLDLSAYEGESSVVFSIAIDTNASSETFYLDSLSINAIPAPAGSFALVFLGGAVAFRRRR